MKFLIDEDLSYKLVQYLINLGHFAIHIREIQLSLEDFEILEIAVKQGFIVITADKDFGEIVFKDSKPHTGVVFLRLQDQTVENTKRVIRWFLLKYSEKEIINKFVVITEKMGRFKARFEKN